MALKQFGGLRYEAEDWTLPSGVKFSSNYPADPVFLNEHGLLTVGRVINYFYENREELKVYLDDRGMHDEFAHINANMCRFVDRRYENAFELSIGQLRYYMENLNNDSYAAYDNRLGSESDRNRSFLLVSPPPTPEDTAPRPNAVLKADYGGRVYLESVNTSRTSDLDPRSHAVWDRMLNYTFKMDPTQYDFFRRTKRCSKSEDQMMFGVELEISTRLSCKEIHYIVTEVEPKQKPFFIFKSDGSVNGMYDNRVEMVTVPATPRYLRIHFRRFFEKLDALAKSKGEQIEDYFDVSTNLNNGLHIHVSRECFMSDVHRRKFNSVWQLQDIDSLQLLNELSSRAINIMDHGYCRPIEGLARRSISSRLKEDRMFTADRNTTCNATNSTTLEVRLFQGIFNMTHVLRCIDTVEAVVNFTRDASNRIIGGGKYRPCPFANLFRSYVLSSAGYKYLTATLKG